MDKRLAQDWLQRQMTMIARSFDKVIDDSAVKLAQAHGLDDYAKPMFRPAKRVRRPRGKPPGSDAPR